MMAISVKEIEAIVAEILKVAQQDFHSIEHQTLDIA